MVEWLAYYFCLSRVCCPSDTKKQLSKPKSTWPARVGEQDGLYTCIPAVLYWFLEYNLEVAIPAMLLHPIAVS